MSGPRPGRPEAAEAVWPWKEAARAGAAEASRARRSGLARAAVAAGLGGLLFFFGAAHAAAVAWSLGGLVAALALLSPRGASLRLEGLGRALGRGVGAALGLLLLAPVFYLVVAPLGLFRRLRGGDALGRALEPGRPSYFVRREPDGPGRLEKPY